MKNTVMLKKNYEFRNVLNKGKYYGASTIEAFILKSNRKCNSLGIAISTKIGNSVIRNRIKRLIKENYRLLEQNMRLENSIIILWNKKVDSNKADFYIVREDMKKIFKEANILKNEEI